MSMCLYMGVHNYVNVHRKVHTKYMFLFLSFKVRVHVEIIKLTDLVKVYLSACTFQSAGMSYKCRIATNCLNTLAQLAKKIFFKYFTYMKMLIP